MVKRLYEQVIASDALASVWAHRQQCFVVLALSISVLMVLRLVACGSFAGQLAGAHQVWFYDLNEGTLHAGDMRGSDHPATTVPAFIFGCNGCTEQHQRFGFLERDEADSVNPHGAPTQLRAILDLRQPGHEIQWQPMTQQQTRELLTQWRDLCGADEELIACLP